MIKTSNPLSRFVAALAITHGMGQCAMAEETHVYEAGGQKYSYTLSSTGDNYTFEFATSPGNGRERFRAALHMFQVLYDDSSINPAYSEFFMKESAKCFVFDGYLYTYRACFLPNDFSPGHQERFWGFLSRLPNALWLITRSLVPALALGGFFVFLLRRKPGIDATSQTL